MFFPAERELAAKKVMRSDTRRFAEHMMAQKREGLSRDHDHEAAREAEMDKAWDQRLAEHSEEQRARERLMAQVSEERESQVMVRLRETKAAKALEAERRRTLESELERLDAMHSQQLAHVRKAKIEHRALLEQQIEERRLNRHAAAEHDKLQERVLVERAQERTF